jgi:hypothetical protein
VEKLWTLPETVVLSAAVLGGNFAKPSHLVSFGDQHFGEVAADRADSASRAGD